MAGIREIARQYRDEIMDGIAWVAIWKTGRSWNARAFWLNTDSDMIEDEDMQEARDIVAADANAIFINEYYCAHMGDGKLEEIVSAIRFFYEEGWHTLADSTAYRAEEKEETVKENKLFSEEELAKVESEEERKHLIECAEDNEKIDMWYMEIMSKYDLWERGMDDGRHEGAEGNQAEAEGHGREGSEKAFPPCMEGAGARVQAADGGENPGGSTVAT